jgi:hypothetical protein
MVGVGRMPHPEEEAEKQEGHDVEGGSGHFIARASRAIPRHTMQRFDPTTTPVRLPRGPKVVAEAGWHDVRMYWTQTVPGLERPLGEVVRLTSKSDLERARLIREARAIYESIFPPAVPVSEPRDSKR